MSCLVTVCRRWTESRDLFSFRHFVPGRYEFRLAHWIFLHILDFLWEEIQGCGSSQLCLKSEELWFYNTMSWAGKASLSGVASSTAAPYGTWQHCGGCSTSYTLERVIAQWCSSCFAKKVPGSILDCLQGVRLQSNPQLMTMRFMFEWRCMGLCLSVSGKGPHWNTDELLPVTVDGLN